MDKIEICFIIGILVSLSALGYYFIADSQGTSHKNLEVDYETISEDTVLLEVLDGGSGESLGNVSVYRSDEFIGSTDDDGNFEFETNQSDLEILIEKDGYGSETVDIVSTEIQEDGSNEFDEDPALEFASSEIEKGETAILQLSGISDVGGRELIVNEDIYETDQNGQIEFEVPEADNLIVESEEFEIEISRALDSSDEPSEASEENEEDDADQEQDEADQEDETETLEAKFDISPGNPVTDETVSFDASDSEGNIESYYWSSPDTQLDETESQFVQNEFSEAGEFTFELEVSNEVSTDTETKEIEILEEGVKEPEFILNSPADGETVETFDSETDIEFEFIINDRTWADEAKLKIEDTNYEFTRPISSGKTYYHEFEELPSSYEGENYSWYVELKDQDLTTKESSNFVLGRKDPVYEVLELDPADGDNVENYDPELKFTTNTTDTVDAEVYFDGKLVDILNLPPGETNAQVGLNLVEEGNYDWSVDLVDDGEVLETLSANFDQSESLPEERIDIEVPPHDDLEFSVEELISFEVMMTSHEESEYSISIDGEEKISGSFEPLDSFENWEEEFDEPGEYELQVSMKYKEGGSEFESTRTFEVTE